MKEEIQKMTSLIDRPVDRGHSGFRCLQEVGLMRLRDAVFPERVGIIFLATARSAPGEQTTKWWQSLNWTIEPLQWNECSTRILSARVFFHKVWVENNTLVIRVQYFVPRDPSGDEADPYNGHCQVQ